MFSIVILLVQSKWKEKPTLLFFLTWAPNSVMTLTVQYFSCLLGPAARWDLTDPDVPGSGTAGSCAALCGAPPWGGARRGPGPCAVAQWLPPAGLLRG